MYLKSLEIQGFKSFPDKTRLDFDKGITAVVGPNGSGKSNIGDAVRWVLGEQSSKTLRGSKMEDVIFAGTQLRKPMGFAQVTLEISNSDHVLPLDDDTVAVTRKLYRSGDSEYLINGKPCRLKDITELFMDTGMGRDGYSIIGQGRIAEIISAKSGERRDIFEEAAGISKFRWKKAEAERKLASAQENILRLTDIVTALHDRVEPLRIQSEKAAKFIELSEKQKSAEITVWIYQIDKLKEDLTAIEEKLLINTSDYDSTSAEIDRTDERTDELRRDMQGGNIIIDELRKEFSSFEHADSDIRSEIAVCENEVKHCEEAIAELHRQQENAETLSAETAAKIESELKRIRDAEDEARKNDALTAEAEKKLAGLDIEQQSADSEKEKNSAVLSDLYIQRSGFSAAAENNRTEAENLRSRLLSEKERYSETQKNLSSYDEEKIMTLSALETMEQKELEQQNKLSGLKKLLEAKQSKLDELNSTIDKKNLRLRDAEHKRSILEGLEKSMEGFTGAVKQILSAAKNGSLRGVHGTAAQLISTENKYSTAIETALGGALQNIIVSDENAAKDCIRFLKNKGAGRATFLPLTSVRGNRLNKSGIDGQDGFIAVASELVKCDPKYSGAVDFLLGRTAVAEDIDTATNIAKRSGYKFRIVTLDGQVINAGGSFTGGSLNRSAGILTRKTEIDELAAEQRSLTDELSEMRKKYDRLKAEADKLKFDADALSDSLNTIASDKMMCRAELKRLSDLKEQNERLLADSAEQEKLMNDRISEKLKNAENSEKALHETEEKISAAETLIAENSEKQSSLRTERESLSNEISCLRIRGTEISKEIENARDRIASEEEQQRLRGDNTAGISVKIDEQKRISEENLARIEKLRSDLSDSGEKKERINRDILEKQSENREKEQEMTLLSRKSRELSEVKEKLASEKTRLEEKKNGILENQDSIIRSLEEKYEMYLSEARASARKVDDIIPVNKELAELKQKIRALGNVNVGAVEEYREVSEQYEFMSKELGDVEDSKRKLENIISELTETMKKQFSECFAEINENFKKVFAELFGGGRSELVLSDPANVLESGIEINVAPPGKVIKSLSLLSGGEQAFVAIALYFAILMIRPAPFCILDEIEAALDDVNVARYAGYLRHFTDTTQFITVTHRRGTMEEADVLYGVTMQQKGISRLLKMEHPPAEDIAG